MMSPTPRLAHLFSLGSLSLLAACPFAPTGVVTSASDTTDASTSTSDPTSDPTDTAPTSVASEGTTGITTGVTTDITGGPTDSTDSTDPTGTTGTAPGPAPCAAVDQLIHEDFTDINLRCAVDRAIEKVDTADCMFTCAAAQGLTDLDASGKIVASMAGIRHLVNLTTLKLSDNELTVIEDLHTLTKLKKLYLYNCEITSAAGLDGLTDLEELYLYSNNIDSVAVLPAFQKLTTLALGSNKLTSLDGLPALPTLNRLELGPNPILSSPSLKTLETQTPALTQLFLHEIDLLNLSDLPHLDSLQVLDIGRNDLDSLTGFYAFPKLENLQLYENFLASVNDLAGASATLDTLDLSANGFTSEGLLNLSMQSWLGPEDLIYVGGNDFACGQDFIDALANFETANVVVDPNPPTCF